MKARRKILLQIFSGLVVAAALLIWRPWHCESVYKGKPTSYWVERVLEGNADSENVRAIKALGPEAVLPLLKAMKESDSPFRPLGLKHYNNLPRVFQKLIKPPIKNDSVRERAYRALNEVGDSIKGPESKVLLPILIPYLSDQDQRPSLSHVDADTHMAVPHREFIRSVTADILASMGPDASEAVPALLEALKDKNWSKYHKNLVPRALGRIGPAARDAIPALKQGMEEDSQTAPWYAEALWRIDPTQKDIANEVLQRSFTHTNRSTQVKAVRVHWEINKNPEVAVPMLIELLNDPKNLWMINTMLALKDIGTAATNAIPALKEKLVDKDEVVQQWAEEVIAKIEGEAR